MSMGEYIELKNGGQIKLGTCDDWRYYTYDECVEFLADGKAYARDWYSLVAAMIPDDNFNPLFRHPAVPVTDNMFTTRVATLPKGMLRYAPHKELVMYNSAKGGGYGMNIFVECPQDGTLRTRTSMNNDYDLVQLHGQKMINGALVDVFACGRCGCAFTLDEGDGDLRDALTSAFGLDEVVVVA